MKAKPKPFDIPMQLVKEAYRLVKINAGSSGIDRQSLEEFERNRERNLYKIWNRMSSGSYFPAPVLAVPIPKKSGGTRLLGVPTVSDRIAQMVVRLEFEKKVEPHFLPDSYGYRPNKSAHDALAITRKRCWSYDWVLEYDIKGLFDNIPHDLLLKAVRKHTDSKMEILYIERWLKAPMQHSDGKLEARDCGTPQGGVISPVLSNLYLHYAFDKWMQSAHAEKPWCRYADDGLIHCKTEQEAQQMLRELAERFADCGLELHPDKTRIVYCKDSNRRGDYPNISFDFLGYTFGPRRVENKGQKKLFTGFTPAVSRASMKAMRVRMRRSNVRNRADMSLEEIARWYNPILQGWINYYGKFHISKLYSVLRHFNMVLVNWARNKYKSLKGSMKKAVELMQRIAKASPNLFVHWKIGITSALVV